MSVRKKESVHPLDKRKVKLEKISTKKVVKSVKPVAKDTNKTRRKMVKPAKGNIKSRKDL